MIDPLPSKFCAAHIQGAPFPLDLRRTQTDQLRTDLLEKDQHDTGLWPSATGRAPDMFVKALMEFLALGGSGSRTKAADYIPRMKQLCVSYQPGTGAGAGNCLCSTFLAVA